MGRFSRAATPRTLAIGLIVGVAAILRLAALPSRGLIYWDEAKFLLEGVRLETAFHLMTGAHGTLPAAKAIGTAKPTHALLIAVSFVILGVQDSSALYVNAVASIIAVVLVYRIASTLWDTTVGLVAALVVAVSEYDVIYARSALSESDANALLLLGVLLWLRERCGPSGKRLSPALVTGAALVFGLAFTTNYRIVVYAAVIIGFDLLHGLKPRGWSGNIVRVVQWLTGFLFVPVLWEIVDSIARARGTVLFRSEITRRPATYLSEVVYQIHEGKQSRVLFGPLPYVQWYVAYQGWILTALLVLGIVLALRARSFAWLTVLCPVAVPYLLYVWAPVIVPRNLAAAVPFTAMLIAAALVTVVRRLVPNHARQIALLAAALAVSAQEGIQTWRLSAERSGLTLAARYVAAHGGTKVLSTSEVAAFYLRATNRGRCAAVRVPHSLPVLAADIQAGYSYAVIDHVGGPSSRFIYDHMRAVARYQTTRTTAIGENLIAAENTHPPHGPYPIPYVRVFRLEAIGLPPAAGSLAQVCDLNAL